MIDRRTFLRRFGIGLAAVAAAPTLLAAVVPPDERLVLAKGVQADAEALGGGAFIDDGGYETVCSTPDLDEFYWSQAVQDDLQAQRREFAAMYKKSSRPLYPRTRRRA